MKFTVLGTGSATPQLGKHPSAFLVQIDNEYVLIDCGEATQYRLLEQKIKPNKLKTICISHLHGDHYFGLAGLLSSLSLSQRKEPLTLIGPPDLIKIIELQIENSNNKLNYELIFVPTQNKEVELVLDKTFFKIESFPLIHRIPTTGFLISRAEGKRHILADKLPENFPVHFMGMLKEGLDVEDPMTGEIFKSSDYTIPGTPEKKLAYCSDTAYKPDLIPIIEGANLLYHEATFTDELKSRAEMTQHSTASQAAEIAKCAAVKKLVLGHFSSRYKNLDQHLIEAKSVFQNAVLAEEGKTYSI
ncbi:ribonuclease Z [Marinilongibacter aquaticus]|uniref:ribonuclease Z n=1 Tax=Marinilongibacter aquaticus TaxID=2975157 RepID=UPI0021BDA424|nr:ribonuclease Z [Marinilongibacter aquaticus]UBM59731.1 ribonuclease Z [Marinilongibacter aquaticus]